MSVLLTHGYFIEDDPKEASIMKPYPPLGLLYLSAWLKKHDIQCEVYDSTFGTKEGLKEHLLNAEFQILALYTNLMTKCNLLELIKFVRSEATLAGTKIVLGGPDVTYNMENYLATGADYLIFGEGEQTMLELAECIILGKGTLDEIQGIAYLENQCVHRNEERTKIRDIAELPWPDRDAINMDLYLNTWKKNHGFSTISVSTQRGCPYTCKWCSTAVYGQSYRRRPPEDVIAELLHIQEKYKPDNIWFVDDVFTVSHKWITSFCSLLIDSKIKINYECITRAERLNEPILDLLRTSGCFRIWIGAESGSQKIVDAMDRRVDVQLVRSMIRLAEEKGIQAGTFIMLGYPNETEEDINETINHLIESNPSHFTITLSYPIKGTALYEQVEDSIKQPGPWSEITDRELDFERTYNRSFYDFAIRRVVNKVWFAKTVRSKGLFTFAALKYAIKSRVAWVGMKFEIMRGK